MSFIFVPPRQAQTLTSDCPIRCAALPVLTHTVVGQNTLDKPLLPCLESPNFQKGVGCEFSVWSDASLVLANAMH